MKYKNIISVFIFAIIVGTVSLGCCFKPHTQYSESERRLLEKKPELTKETLFSGSYTSDFEKYVTEPEKLTELLSGLNHPTKAGHQLVAKELAKYFMAR